MQDFVYIKNDVLIPLPDAIEILDKANDKGVLICNDKEQKAQIYAPEINFYLKNSQDTILEKSKNVLKLYEARAHVYDLGLDLQQSKKVQNRIILVDLNKDLAEFLKKHNFKVVALKSEEILAVFGSVGELCAIVKNQDQEIELDFDFLFFQTQDLSVLRKDFIRQSGCYNFANFKNYEECLQFLQSQSPNYHYKTYITYDFNVCQYHQRRSEHCAKCVELCPTVAILKDDEKKHLEFSQVDCLGCGGCVSVCPSGSLDYAPLPKESFFGLCEFYKDKKVLIIPKKMSLEHLNLLLPKDILPFMIEGEKWLSAMHFLTLLQNSGANVIFYTDFVSSGSKEAIDLLNTFFERKFQKKAVFVAKDKKELEQAFKEQEFIKALKFDFHNNTLTTRENFAKRMQHMILDEDFGSMLSGEWLRYGKIQINPYTCTLCLSCVGACNVGALIADAKENALKFNASLCTTCGYCETSCAEKDTLKLVRSGMEFNRAYFEYQVIAKDELFACIECGKEFATQKAIEKIATLMKPKFGNDQNKIKTLYCCADCKAKVMIQAMALR
ncbi:4Fe-4S dicluster domain-containing protein [Campylobacter sp. VicNov18]|uniref:4Fe-4S dicluster domain-containing protein n=1 Tax=Campylobacter bilis TaxID=2691918 RepID=UPI00130DDEBE|nr:4Fe-4S dicluster domain-containing protein [Campylobacter bilis]MPV64099.1 4Fe-4S dicluster domain-containing protein [Campylobacter hepaticus]MBM0637602.1 4Fe-4S dicluster domain-containing protein [Campylobacter bilis]MCC8278328.1 4Fe-4S dicluster domain-containing protein [Campylobacter bilis]MCC8299831.1 4Fe-4S dicluster domain-containing protein [Campylobacter bilis]MCC8301237.1 4Fe-4S dicluster domain-containing protein [Campylobacter bilis]